VGFDLASRIRSIPDFPKKGILFRDITPLLKDPEAFRYVIDTFSDMFEGEVDVVAGIEARGFIIAAPVAYKLGLPFVPLRKLGKLPWKKLKAEYWKEYGLDGLEVHADAIGKGDRVLIVDDLLATGGTSKAAVELVERLGGTVRALAFIIELKGLKGREKLKGYDVVSLIGFEDEEL